MKRFTTYILIRFPAIRKIGKLTNTPVSTLPNNNADKYAMKRQTVMSNVVQRAASTISSNLQVHIDASSGGA